MTLTLISFVIINALPQRGMKQMSVPEKLNESVYFHAEIMQGLTGAALHLSSD